MNKVHGNSTGAVRQFAFCSGVKRREPSRNNRGNAVNIDFVDSEQGAAGPWGEGRPLANPVWGRGGVGT